MARFCALFSGSNGNCSYISVSDTAILVDAGRSCKQLMLAMRDREIDPASIRGILITHEHSDHISGLRVLLGKLKVPVYASTAVLEKLEWDGLLPPGQKAVPLNTGDCFSVGSLQVRCFDTPHDSIHSMGFRIETPDGRRMAIATDLGYVTDEVRRMLTGCDLVLLESNYEPSLLSASSYPYHLKQRIASNLGHLSNSDCAAELCGLIRTGTTRLVLGHLSGNNNLPELARQCALSTLLSAGMREGVDFMLQVASRSGRSEMVIL